MIGCFIALVFNCILGSVWYSPKQPMGRLWLKRYYPGKTELDLGKGAGTAYTMSVVAAAFMILLVKFLLSNSPHVTSVQDSLKLSVGLSCVASLLELPHVIFSQRFLDIFLLDQIYNMVVMVVTGLCITYFG